MAKAPSITRADQLSYPRLPLVAGLEKQEEALERDLVGLGIVPDPWRLSEQLNWNNAVRVAIYGIHELDEFPGLIENARARAAPFLPHRLTVAWRLGRPDLRTHNALGQALHVDHKTVAKYLCGKVKPNIQFAQKAAEVLGVSLDFLSEGKLRNAPLWLQPFIEMRNRAMRLRSAASELRGAIPKDKWHYQGKIAHALGLLLKGNRHTDDQLITNHQPDATRAAVARLLMEKGLAPPQVIREVSPYMAAMPAFVFHLEICSHKDYERTRDENMVFDALMLPMERPGFFDEHGAPSDLGEAKVMGEAMRITLEKFRPKYEPAIDPTPSRRGRKRKPR